MIPLEDLDETRYATRFEERETGNELIRSGAYVGEYVVEAGKRPFPERDAVYEPVELIDHGESKRADVAVLDVD